MLTTTQGGENGRSLFLQTLIQRSRIVPEPNHLRNLQTCMKSADSNPLLTIMDKAAQSGEDALEDLRTCMRREVYEDTSLHWHYTIPTMPPIFVADIRADR